MTRDLEDTSRLHSRRDGQEIGSVECVQFDLCAEGGLGNREVQRRDEIRARPLEPVVGLDAEMYVKIPGRSTPQGRRPRAGNSQGGAVVDACGYLDGEGSVVQSPAFATAVGAGRGHDLPKAVASPTRRRRHHLAEDRLAYPLDLARAAAVRAGTGARPGAGAAAFTARARHRCFEAHLTTGPEDGLCECDLQNDLRVGPLTPRPPLSS